MVSDAPCSVGRGAFSFGLPKRRSIVACSAGPTRTLLATQVRALVAAFAFVGELSFITHNHLRLIDR
jgi:hypothetical protein